MVEAFRRDLKLKIVRVEVIGESRARKTVDASSLEV